MTVAAAVLIPGQTLAKLVVELASSCPGTARQIAEAGLSRNVLVIPDGEDISYLSEQVRKALADAWENGKIAKRDSVPAVYHSDKLPDDQVPEPPAPLRRKVTIELPMISAILKENKGSLSPVEIAEKMRATIPGVPIQKLAEKLDAILSEEADKSEHDVRRRDDGSTKARNVRVRSLKAGAIIRDRVNPERYLVCRKSTKDATLEDMRKIFEDKCVGLSWRKISDRYGYEYNNGMTVRNLFLRYQNLISNGEAPGFNQAQPPSQAEVADQTAG